MLTAITEEPVMEPMVVMISLYWNWKLPFLDWHWLVFLNWDLMTSKRESWQATGSTSETRVKLVRQTSLGRWNIIIVRQRGMENRSAVRNLLLRTRPVENSWKKTSVEFPARQRRSWFFVQPSRITQRHHTIPHFVLRKSTQRRLNMVGAWLKATTTTSTVRWQN